MSQTDPGYLFLLLPCAAALYYCCPVSRRTEAFCLLSAVLFVFLQPVHAVWMLPSILFDALTSFFICRRGRKSYLSKTFLLLSVVKDVSLLLIFGILRPLFGAGGAPACLLVSHSCALAALLLQKKGGVRFSSPLLFCGYTLFAGHLSLGPIADPARVVNSIKKTECSFQKVGQGAFLVVFGVMKRALLSEQLFALYKTLLRLTAEQMSVGAAWMTALCPALGLFFVFSAYSDIAVGTGLLFGVELPRMTYYPLQACGAREAVYHLNMPLQDLLGRLFSPFYQREDGSRLSFAVSLLSPFALAVLLGPGVGTLFWAAWLSAACALDCFLTVPKRRSRAIILRLLTFLCLLPSYALLGQSPSESIGTLGAMLGLGGLPLTNDVLLYLILSNGAVLAVSVLLSTSLLSSAQRNLHRRFPAVWWLCSAAVCIPVLIITTSFIIRM